MDELESVYGTPLSFVFVLTRDRGSILGSSTGAELGHVFTRTKEDAQLFP